MNTITIWLLLSVSMGYGNRSTAVIERFATEADCIATMTAIKNPYPKDHLQCVRANVLAVSKV